VRARRETPRERAPEILRITPALLYLLHQVLDRLGTGVMPDYRLYFLDRFSGHIEGAENFHAADDVAAIHRIQLRGSPEPMELWSGARKVSRFDGVPQAAAHADPTRRAEIST
jgi:hypothetical protein